MCRCAVKPRTKRSRESWRKDIEVRVKDKAWLRAVMANRGVGSAAELARRAGLSHQAVAFLLSEASWGRSTCSLDTAVRVADALQWDMHDLFVPKPSTQRTGAVAGAQRSAA